jgi:sorbitol-6-phosphate 2-dehydrogenase
LDKFRRKSSVIITGGAAGIGLAVAQGFVEVGAKVMIADFAEETGQKAAEEVSQKGSGEAAFARCDVSSKADVDAVVAKTLEKWGTVDALVNNAGINIPRFLVDPAGKEELTEDVWDKVFAVNVKGQFLFAQAVARVFFQQSKPGVLINMSSESGQEGSEGQSVYAATKAANHNLTRSWAKELGQIQYPGGRAWLQELWKPQVCAASLTRSRSLTPAEFRSMNCAVSMAVYLPSPWA